MIKLKKPTARAQNEEVEDKKTEDANAQSQDGKKKKSPGEIRVQKELMEIDIPSYTAVNFPDANDVMTMQLTVDLSKEQCHWRGGKYLFTIEVGPNYPHDPPKVRCNTQIYHPNIDLEGHVCLNILRDDWRPVLGINAVMLGLIFLFIEPNPNDPLNHEAAEVMRTNKTKFI